MDLDWEKLFKRYVWHDEKTPYLTRVAKLTRVRALPTAIGWWSFWRTDSAGVDKK
jgi:hypothetical protein